jgi:hypothetical protein
LIIDSTAPNARSGSLQGSYSSIAALFIFLSLRLIFFFIDGRFRAISLLSLNHSRGLLY